MKVIIEAAVEHVLSQQRAENELRTQANQHIFNVLEQANAADITPSADEGVQ